MSGMLSSGASDTSGGIGGRVATGGVDISHRGILYLESISVSFDDALDCFGDLRPDPVSGN